MNFDDYKNTMEYPERPKKPTRPFLGKNATSLEVKNHIKDLENYEREMAAYKNEFLVYKAKLTKETKAWYFAWEHGQDGGYSDVLNWLYNVAYLLKD